MGHFPHGERRAATGVAIKFRQYDASDPKGLVEMGRHAYGLLASCRIGHLKYLLWPEEFLQLSNFLDQNGIDFLPPSSVENLHIAPLFDSPIEAGGGRAFHVFLVRQ